jgi:hypothetical protein
MLEGVQVLTVYVAVTLLLITAVRVLIETDTLK